MFKNFWERKTESGQMIYGVTLVRKEPIVPATKGGMARLKKIKKK